MFCSKSMACHDIVHGDDVCKTVNNAHKVNCGSNKWRYVYMQYIIETARLHNYEGLLKV